MSLCIYCNINKIKENAKFYCSASCNKKHKMDQRYELWIAGGDEPNVHNQTLRAMLKRKEEYKCSECKLTSWQGKELTLYVDHIDGNSSNNKLSNVRFMCPNCHSQTPTYGNRNIGKGRKSLKKNILCVV